MIMAINAYIGIPGSGKTYEVVSNVILVHFRKGRRIVTNIEGITHQGLMDWLVKYEPKFDLSLAGQLIHVTDSDCQSDHFFPYKGSTDDTICRAGDLICLDEIWRIFPSDKIKENHRSFVAEHRHFTDPDTGLCCDLVVINQSIAGIPRFIKDRIETTYMMRRLLSLGLKSRYSVSIFTGAKTTKTNLVTQYQNKYCKLNFELYKSFDTTNGKQDDVDSRNNFFKSFTFKSLVLFICSAFGLSLYLFYSFFGQFGKTSDKDAGVQNTSQTQNQVIVRKDKAQDDLRAMVKPKSVSNIISKNWRIVGEMQKESAKYVILSDLKGNLRLLPRHYFKGNGRLLSGVVDGELVSYYSGVKSDEQKINIINN